MGRGGVKSSFANEHFTPSQNNFKSQKALGIRYTLRYSNIAQKSILFQVQSIWNNLCSKSKSVNTTALFMN